jgi:M6 family metalloprotease-like protein
MQGIVVSSIAHDELAAVARATRSTVVTAPKVSTISGTLREQHMDEFEAKTHTVVEKNATFYLDQGNGKSIIISPKSVDESLVGQKVAWNPTTSVVEGGGDRGGGTVQTAISMTRPAHKKVLVFLAQFSNSTPVTGTTDQYKDILFGPTNGYVRKFYAEMTHNKVILDATVKGWYHFSGPGSQYPLQGQGNCYISPTAVQQMADFYQVNITNYDVVITISNCEEYNNLGGITYTSGPRALPGKTLIQITSHYDRLGIDGSNGYTSYPDLVWTNIHELGHFFGLQHSNTLDCMERTIWNDCTNVEYGNPFDAMGHWGRIFNFLQQRQAGWIGDGNILIIDHTGSYHLDNLQTNQGVVGAEIKVPGIDHPIYAMEHRAATGFDSTLPDGSDPVFGLLLYSYIQPSGPGQSLWRLVDPHPTPSAIFDDTVSDAITATKPYNDPNLGVSIDVTSVNQNGINFNVAYQNPLYVPPLAPSNLNIVPNLTTPDTHDYFLNWQDNSNDETGFQIMASELPNMPYPGVQINAGSNATQNALTLFPNNTYYFKMKATGQLYDSNWSEIISISP